MFRGLTELKLRVIKWRETWSYLESYALLIGPFTLFARLMGFVSFKVKSSKLVFWKLHFVYATILTILYVIGMIYATYVLNTHYKFRDTVNKWQANIIVVFISTTYVLSYANNRSMFGAIERVSNVSRVILAKTFCKLTKGVVIKDLLLIMLLLSFIPIILKFNFIMIHLMTWYGFFGALTLNNLYTNNVFVLRRCFKQINESLKKVKEMLINDEPHLLRRVFHAQKNPMLLAILRSQKQRHLETSKAVCQLNSAFSMQLETSLFLLLIDTTFNIYSYILVYNDGDVIKKVGYDIAFVILNLIHIVATISIIDITRSEMEKIGWNIHRILIHTSDDRITMELEMFSLQVLQRGNTFTLKAIALDFTYLTQIVCGITTILLILVQFLLGSPC